MLIDKKMSAQEYFKKMEEALRGRKDVEIEKYSLKYKAGTFSFWKIKSKNIKLKDKVFLIRAGIHGEEIAGPLTILNNINKILDIGKKTNIKFIIYPLDNPSGFENGKRYNIDNDKGEAGNNDYIRYKLKNGKFSDELKNVADYKNWYWSSQKTKNLPLETKFSQKLIKKDPLKQVVAFLDLHQDYITQNVPALAYNYSFGDLKKYKSIIKKVSKIIPIYKNTIIGAGFNMTLNSKGEAIQTVDEYAPKSDENGFVIRHDGSLGDLFYRLGVENSVTVETTGVTTMKKAMEINMIWIKGVFNLIEKNK